MCHHPRWRRALGTEGVNGGIVSCLLEVGNHIVWWYSHFIRVKGQSIFISLRSQLWCAAGYAWRGRHVGKILFRLKELCVVCVGLFLE